MYIHYKVDLYSGGTIDKMLLACQMASWQDPNEPTLQPFAQHVLRRHPT